MTFSWDLLDQLSDEYGLDIDAMLAVLGEPDDDGNWTYSDDDENGVPDILQSLIEDPISTNDSQGGALG